MSLPRSRRALLAGVAGSLGAVAGCLVDGSVRSRDSPDDGPTTGVPTTVGSFQYDAANAGSNPETTGPGAAVTERWRADGWSAEETSPVLVDDAVLCAGSGNVAAFDRSDGSKRWEESLGLDSGGTPVIDGDRVYVPTWNTNGIGVHALAVDTGEHLWHARSRENVSRAPTALDGVVYTGGGLRNERLVALDGASGDELWDVPLGEYVTTPAVVDDVVYAGGGMAGDYVALEADTGEERWRFETDARAWAAPTVVADAVYVGLRDGTLRAIERDDGTERWRLSVGDDLRYSVAVDGETVYVTSRGEDGSRLVAVDIGADEPTIRWTSPGCDTAPIAVDDVVYVGQNEDVVALEADTSDERWSVTVDSRREYDVVYSGVRNPPTVADGVVYVQTFAGDLYALESA